MLLDYIARNNNMSYSVNLAKALGVYSAIYTNLLIDMYVLNKKEEYIKLSRDEIYTLTGIEEDLQLKAEDNLMAYHVIEMTPVKNSSSKNYYKLNLALIEKLITKDSSEIGEELQDADNPLFKALTKAPTKVSKRQKVVDSLKLQITTKDKQSKEYLENWIDNVYQKSNYLSKDGVNNMINALKEYSNKDVNVFRELCRLAAILAYKDPKWIIDKYEKEKQEKSNTNSILTLNTETQNDIEDNLNKLKNYQGETF